MQKIQLCITGMNYIFKYTKIENSYLKLKNNNNSVLMSIILS